MRDYYLCYPVILTNTLVPQPGSSSILQNQLGVALDALTDCVKYFIDDDVFRKFSTKYGLDSEIVASFCESFATYVDLPKEKWFKYHPPIKRTGKG